MVLPSLLATFPKIWFVERVDHRNARDPYILFRTVDRAGNSLVLFLGRSCNDIVQAGDRFAPPKTL